jgi:PAS domain S-box-containing protein
MVDPPSAIRTAVNEYQENMADTPARTASERHIEGVREQGGMFVEAVRVTRMPMLVTDATLPGNPITFANGAFIELSGYGMNELVGQDPHFMNGPQTDPEAIRQYELAMAERRDATLEILQYRKDGTPFRAMLFASPLGDGQGTIANHFLSYLDVTRRYEAEESLRALTSELEERVAARTRELEDANQTLRNLDMEREMLLVEVNHRAKNSLAIAASLLGLQGRRQSDSTVKAPFQETQERLSALSRVHDLLSKSENAQRVDLARYVVDLCEAMNPTSGSDNRIRLQATAQPGIMIKADTAIPLGIIITELITNSLKYAFPSPRSGTITAQAERTDPRRITVTVADDGVGFSDLREGSLGIGLIRSLVRQIGGSIEMRGDNGVTATITFAVS